MKGADGVKSFLKMCQDSELTVTIVCDLFVAVKLCRRWGFVCNKSPTYFGEKNLSTAARGQKSRSPIKTTPKKPFSDPALTFLDATSYH